MTGHHLVLAVLAVCIVWLLPFTASLGKLFAVYIYRKYFFREDIYVTYKVDGEMTAKYLIRKNSDGSITQRELSEPAWGKNP